MTDKQVKKKTIERKTAMKDDKSQFFVFMTIVRSPSWGKQVQSGQAYNSQKSVLGQLQ